MGFWTRVAGAMTAITQLLDIALTSRVILTQAYRAASLHRGECRCAGARAVNMCGGTTHNEMRLVDVCDL